MKEESVSGHALRFIQSALPEAQKVNLNLEMYKIYVVMNENPTVIFIDANATWPPKVRGNPGKIPGYEVTIDGKTYAVIKAAYIR